MQANDSGPDRPNGTAPAAPAVIAHAPYAPPAALSAAPSLAALLQALRRRWLVAAALSLACAAGVAAAVWFLLPPPKNSASALLRLQSDDRGVLFNHPEAIKDFRNFQTNQAALLRSRLVLTAALRRPEVADLETLKNTTPPNPVEWLEKELKVDFPESPELMRVSLAGQNTEELRTLVDAIVETYFREVVEEQTKARQVRWEELQALQKKYEKRCNDRQAAIRAQTANIGGASDKVLESRAAVTEELIGAVRQDLIRANTELLRLRTVETLGKGGVAMQAEIAPDAVETAVAQDKRVRDLLEKQDQLQTKLKRTVAVSSDEENSDRVRAARRELKDNQRALDETRIEVRAEVVARAGELVKLDAKTGRSQLHSQIVFQEELARALQQEIDTLTKNRIQIVGNQFDLRRDLAELAQLVKVLEVVNGEVTRLEVEMKTPARVKSWQAAVGYEVNPTLRKIKLAGGGAGGVLGLILVGIAFLEFRVRRIGSAEEVSRGLGMAVVGTLPACPTRGAGASGDWNRLLTEAADATRTLLLYRARHCGMRVVMVTSAVSGEGKTSLSGHLAVSLARAGLTTLLVDCDLRNPSCHRIFDLPEGPGVAELLRGEAVADECVQPTEAPGLAVLTAGVCDGAALRALSQGGLHAVLAQLRPRFDFIVLDSSPVLPVADSMLIGQEADGVIFSVLREVSRLPNVYAAQQRLAGLGIPVLGAVVSGTRAEGYGYNPRLLGAAAGEVAEGVS